VGRGLLKGAIWLIGGVFALLCLAAAFFLVLAAVRETDDAVPREITRVETPLGIVAAAVSGPADGAPILLVHGTAAWSGFWRDVSAHLAAKGWRVIAVDLPPFGYSGHDPAARYDRASQAQRLSATLRRLTSRPVVVVGHSFGAGAATELALRQPDQVKSLILVDAALGVLDPPNGARGALAGILGVAPIAEPMTAAAVTNPWFTGALLRSMIARKETAEAWLPTLQQPMRRPGSSAAYAAWLPALFMADDGGWSRRTARLAAIRPPVAIIWGEADTVTPPVQGARLATVMRARSYTRLPGVGHIPHIEDPAAFLDALDRAIAPDRGQQ
jgi:pimeloyl-ACP methyl ester carboxylesterase